MDLSDDIVDDEVIEASGLFNARMRASEEWANGVYLTTPEMEEVEYDSEAGIYRPINS